MAAHSPRRAPHLTRRDSLALGLGGIAGLLMPVAAGATTRMRYVTPFNFSLSYAAVFYAKAGGYFDTEGLDVDIQNGRGAATAAQLVIATQADVARTGGANYITARVDAGAPLVSIGTIAQVSPFFLVSPADAPLKSAADLRGKTIGVASLGGSMDGTLNLMLRASGVAAADVERVKVADVPASYGLIEGKRINGFLASISSVVKIAAAVPAVQTLAIDDGIPGQVYVASPAALSARPDDFIRFLRAVAASATAILDASDRTPILKAIGGAFEIPGIDDTTAALADLDQNAKTWIAKGRDNLLRNVPEHWAGALKTMNETGMVKGTIDPAALYDNGFRDKALGRG